MKLFNIFGKNEDERIQAEVNKIYRVGYYVLMFGICFDLCLQVASPQPVENSFGMNVRLIEFAVFLLANVVCLVMMMYKGFSDDSSHYAELDTFAHGHYLRISVLAALAVAVFFGILYAWNFSRGNGMEDELPLILAAICVSMFLSVAVGIYGLEYLCFRIARRRRKKIEREMDDSDE